MLRPAAVLVRCAFAVVAAMHGEYAAASDAPKNVDFDGLFLRSGAAVDVSRFERGSNVAPGSYNVDIWLNGMRIARDDVRFVPAGEDGSTRPCFARKMLEHWGVDFSRIAAGEARATSEAATACIDVSTAVPQATVDFDFNEQKLEISIPQMYIRNRARGYVSPELWDNGVNAGFVSYSANAYQFNNGGARSTQGYLGVNVGVNVGGWHFRHQSSLTAMTGQKTQFDAIATFVQHDVTKLKSQAVVGESHTTGDVFDSFAFRGAQIATDDRMLPESLRGYAPIVRGMAESNARVRVNQNGQTLYETIVPPGPFEIDDLYPTGYGGNLEVTVTEADGREKSFTVPYAAVAQSLRPGITRFAFTAGELRNDSLRSTPVFAQLTVQRGLTNLVTLYGGGIAASGYVAANLGATLNTPLGAVAADVTMARTQVPGQASLQGHSLHIGYSKFIDSTDTNIALGAYRYSSAGYLNFADAARFRDYVQGGSVGNPADRTRGQFQLTVSQSLAGYGSVFANVTAEDYWNRSGRNVFYQAGYSNGYRFGTYSVTLGRTENANGTPSNEIMLTTTISLGRSRRAPTLSASFNQSGNQSSLQTSVGGTVGDRSQYSYNVYGAMRDGSAGGVDVNGGASGTYRGRYAQLTASASGGAHSSQMAAGASGSIVAHPGGVTFSQTVSETFGVVEAKGAQGADVRGAPGVEVGADGYAVVPYLTPYSMNTVELDPKGVSMDVEFASTSESVAPRFGSVVMLKYRTVMGRAALIRAPQLGGDALPFGAMVSDGNGMDVGVVAQNSRIFARGLEDDGTLIVKWGEEPGQQCSVRYSLPVKRPTTDVGYVSVESHCLSSRALNVSAITP
ncbi:fimbria/pilus outer membrane usher protein [Paraburkholderia sp. LEh10]|uniref:fimbria/pilus outer membrane usher protein n=1 Tax=Paraburkholderia sp. LEh10 TaxID=2821353 RepID=UPI0028B1D08B|nr:fimbria/pilus outer membrane usher protein [Paraburkholderia sp. LEh10]